MALSKALGIEDLVDEVVKEFQKKIDEMLIPRNISIEKVLITVNGVDDSVLKLDYFHSILKIEDLFKKF